MASQQAQQLKKVLKPIHLWAIAVSLVISGEYVGWNLGWGVSGTVGFLIATVIITVMYVTFVFSYTELTTSIPHAGGAFAYAYHAMGPFGALVAGYATVIDLMFATPVIASGLGSYIHFLYPGIPVIPCAMTFYLIFMGLNISGVKESAVFSIVVAMLAIAELLLFMGVIAPSFKIHTFLTDSMPFGWGGVFAALPFAIWFYLAIEGVAMVAEEVKEPKKDIPKGYISGIVTLVFLAFGVMILSGGITNWKNLSKIDYPLPEAIGIVLGKTNGLTKMFAGIGLFGLIASFHGTILAYSRQLFAMARSGYLPGFLSAVNKKFNTPHWAIIAGGVIGCIAILTGTTDQILVLSVLGAVVMYLMSMLSLFILRIRQPHMERPFAAPFYPVFPGVALLIAVVSLFAIIWYNPVLSLLFLGGLILTLALFILLKKHKAAVPEDLMSVTIDI
ncbi:ethanolamine permease [Mucilaginibacter sp. PPCGB 2223]|uniref:ethanolamine permease n=1 Tax=Mucilaginibacter sp. PPCGB 2223 TaxID=1886027 RepID=UPI00082508F4|nr:ethanolamine permease [Mucilaginibacter sp. PPCGB 2223]OCX54114.1 ethanolamine permease [Mucilaginibacter sp. PPCGB 2223]